MEDTHLAHGEQDSIVNEVHDRLQGLIGAHSTHVDLLLELSTTLAHHVDGTLADGISQMRELRGGLLLGLILRDRFETAHIHVTADQAESDFAMTTTDGKDFANGLLAFEADKGAIDMMSERRAKFKQEIDVRGMRADEALQAVMYFIDDAILLSMSEVRILHGTGTGALRQAIRQYLSTVPGIANYHDEHVQLGGAGITVVEID